MNLLIKRWWQPALLLFVLVLISSCRQTPTEVLDTPSPVPTVEVPETDPTPTAQSVSSATPLPMFEYKGIEFAFDESVLGPLGAAEYHAPVPPGNAPVQPEHLEIRLKAGDHNISPVLYIFPVQQYEALSEEAAKEIADLRGLLAERPQEVLSDLPLLPMYEAIESYHSDPKYIDFRNGSGISYIARVDHDHSLTTDESLFYTFQGLTSDEQFYVATLVPITDVDTEEPGDPADDLQEGEATEHRAKAAVSNGNWISIDLGDGRSLIDDMMLSLQVMPDESFPAIKLPSLLISNGLFLAYDEAISGEASSNHSPSLVENPDGDLVFLESVPDLLNIRFRGNATDGPGAELRIQPIRDEQGEFFEAIPEWQQDEISSLALDDIALTSQLLNGGAISEVQNISFQSGSGVRGLASISADINGKLSGADSMDSYLFRGISNDGRYMIQFNHPIPSTMALQEAITYLDSLITSLQVSPGASTGSSMPLNPADCEKAVEFVEDVSIPDYTVVDRGDTFVKIWRVRNSGSCTWTPAYHVIYAQGNPTEWQAMAIAEIVPPGEETEVGITVQSPAYPGIYQAWWQLADEEGQQFGDQLGLLFEAPKPATDIPGYGVVEGEINYPANSNPAIEIYFQKTDSSERYVMETEQGWTHFSKAIPVGSYYVFARVFGDTSDSGGGYTKAVICGLHADCNEHDLVEVVVEEGRASRNINLFDWYAPAGSFPLPDPGTKPDQTSTDG